MSDQLNKSDLIAAVAESAELSKAQAGRTVDAVISTITDSLAKGTAVSIPGFGSFLVKHRKERKGLNPQTKESITIPATDVPAFKAGKALKEAVKS